MESSQEKAPDTTNIRSKMHEVFDTTEHSAETHRLFSETTLRTTVESDNLRQQAMEQCANPSEFEKAFDAWQEILCQLADETSTGEGRIRKSVTEAQLFYELREYSQALDRLENDALLQADQMGFDELVEKIQKLIKILGIR